MADCQDLVNAVNNVDTTLQSILAEIQETKAIQGEIREAIVRVEVHLGFRLTSRAYQHSAHQQTILAINGIGEVVAERIAQHSQQTMGNSAILATDLPDVLPADAALDADSPGGGGGGGGA